MTLNKIATVLLVCFFAYLPLVCTTNTELFEHKNIVVLGGTGYLGRALTKELLKYNPKNVTIVSKDEVKHFNNMRLFNNHSKLKHVIGDIRDYQSLLQVTSGVDIVFHVAALKRMDALESNVEEAIKTNVLGSLNVFNACVANDVKQVLFISTDKACYPINAYGACKFISEKIFTNYDPEKIKTKFLVARFGNILESTGSVIPVFIEKIKNGEPIPLTDKQMTRFIISKEEAVALLFDALRYGTGGEIFIKSLPAYRLIDLIEVLKHKFGANNEIKVIGLRPGEKIHEMLINESEMMRTYEFKDYFVIRPSVDSLYNNHQETRQPRLGRSMGHQTMNRYSSDQAFISHESLIALFGKLDLL